MSEPSIPIFLLDDETIRELEEMGIILEIEEEEE